MLTSAGEAMPSIRRRPFAYALGGGYELPLTPTILLRPVQVDYLQTNLPNGSDNRQRNIRLSAGIVLQLSVRSLGR